MVIQSATGIASVLELATGGQMPTPINARTSEIDSLVRRVHILIHLTDQAIEWALADPNRSFSAEVYNQMLHAFATVIRHPDLAEGDLRDQLMDAVDLLRNGKSHKTRHAAVVDGLISRIRQVRNLLRMGALPGWKPEEYVGFAPRLDVTENRGRSITKHPYSQDGALFIVDSMVLPAEARAFVAALKHMAVEAGQEVSEIGPALQGSWYQKFWVRLTADYTPDEAQRATRRLAQGLEDALVHERSAAIDQTRSQTTLNLMKAAEGINNFAAVLGDVLLIKITDGNGRSHVQVKTLTATERHVLERNDWMALRDPEAMLMSLSGAVEAAASDPSIEPNSLSSE
ncbi:hypothetical protein KIH74_20065 [Kineosporia sp. J2-2]|uniref:Uncharacterized protein n=1 Tax=Kineosporia corallincola TaxID=2835133 RepID=A0ABS5TJJ5_9ACTN|nr:hypothetical protein [Kineosporia corallincola]MBT0771246.1 hypothetical protein [Kineosporia corallincola]